MKILASQGIEGAQIRTGFPACFMNAEKNFLNTQLRDLINNSPEHTYKLLEKR
jgi:hypothetical protein